MINLKNEFKIERNEKFSSRKSMASLVDVEKFLQVINKFLLVCMKHSNVKFPHVTTKTLFDFINIILPTNAFLDAIVACFYYTLSQCFSHFCFRDPLKTHLRILLCYELPILKLNAIINAHKILT